MKQESEIIVNKRHGCESNYLFYREKVHITVSVMCVLDFTYISGVLDLFLPLKNSGRALRSMA